jgi:hypothetical protein
LIRDSLAGRLVIAAATVVLHGPAVSPLYIGVLCAHMAMMPYDASARSEITHASGNYYRMCDV